MRTISSNNHKTAAPMIKNISYNNPSLQQEINQLVGTPYSLIQRIKLKGTGSSRMPIIECSSEIHALLSLDNNTNKCSIEIRPNGILVHFRSILESYAWIIPYYKLTLYKTNTDSYSLHADQHKIMLKSNQHGFFKRLLDEKVKTTSSLPLS